MDLNYVVHRAYIRKTILVARKEQKKNYMEALRRSKGKVWGKERSCLDWATSNMSLLTYVYHCLNIMEIYPEEFRDNLCI